MEKQVGKLFQYFVRTQSFFMVNHVVSNTHNSGQEKLVIMREQQGIIRQLVAVIETDQIWSTLPGTVSNLNANLVYVGDCE